MSTPFRKQVYTQASADWKDFDGFLEEMSRSLRSMGIYVVDDPALDGSDMNGVIFHQGPIDPKKLWAWLHKQDPDLYRGRLTKAKEMSLTPPSFFEVDSWITFKGDKTSKNEWQVIDKKYSTFSGWMYTIRKHHSPVESILTHEEFLSHIEGFDPSPFATPYKRKYR